MTRIVAGTHGGRRLGTPPGRDTRPTSDRVREALFGTVDSLTDLDGARFADLYAGSGAVGLEAVSRGAAHVLLVESDGRATRVIRENIDRLGVRDAARPVQAPVEQVVAGRPDAPYDVVFLDPPYASAGEVRGVLAALVRHGWLAPDALVVVEHATRDGRVGAVEGVTEVRIRRYGETTLWYGRRS